MKQYINPIHLLQSTLHVVQIGIGYLLMFVVMTFNGWLFLAVSFGDGLGYIITGRCRQSVNTTGYGVREDDDVCD